MQIVFSLHQSEASITPSMSLSLFLTNVAGIKKNIVWLLVAPTIHVGFINYQAYFSVAYRVYSVGFTHGFVVLCIVVVM